MLNVQSHPAPRTEAAARRVRCATGLAPMESLAVLACGGGVLCGLVATGASVAEDGASQQTRVVLTQLAGALQAYTQTHGVPVDAQGQPLDTAALLRAMEDEPRCRPLMLQLTPYTQAESADTIDAAGTTHAPGLFIDDGYGTPVRYIAPAAPPGSLAPPQLGCFVSAGPDRVFGVDDSAAASDDLACTDFAPAPAFTPAPDFTPAPTAAPPPGRVPMEPRS